ncbi:YVTN family beta-propeller protein [Anaerobacterium chartisolvens]|uniref:YVTN family beta-propeller protein n=1 Tax=Anaerobacterium chartisolvens TaxID=1297424 RepID=A0A369AH51_9FIRM|nr:RICIN domain-containing protein [Anaerobacterium chartisolvens]RCX08491.1 YVTN family beta-propeller protein [Anaerobacterium chartisolvens]
MSKRTYMKFTAIALAVVVAAVQLFYLMPVLKSTAAAIEYFSPYDVAYSPDGTMIAVSDATKAKLNIITASTGVIANTVQLNGEPKGIAWSGNTRVYVAEYGAAGVAEIDPAAGKVLSRIATGPKTLGLAVVGNKLVATDFGLNYVSIVDLTAKTVLGKVSVKNYPYFIDITPDGRYAAVGHATPTGDASDVAVNASTVTLIDMDTQKVSSNILLPSGSTNVRAVKCSPDGKWVYAAHTIGRTSMPTTQITKGWTNTDGVSIIDVANNSLYTTVLLDTLMEGAADPWGLAVSPDSKTLWVSISGTHQVYKLDLYNLHELLLGNIPGAGAQVKLINRTSGKALDVPGGSTANGTQMIQWTDNGGNNQKWSIIADSSNRYYYIQSYVSKKNLDNYGSQVEGAPINQYDQSGSSNQQWSMVDLGGGYYRFVNRTSGKALDNGGSTANDAGIIQKTVSSSNDQQWRVVPIGGGSGPDLLNRSKSAYSKPYSDIWFTIKADPSKRTLLVNDLGALWSAGLLTKVKLPGQGPRGLAIAPDGKKAAVGAYFAGDVYMIDTAANKVTQTIPLGTQPQEDSVRRGERIYHDASTTLQKWLSCATCHPSARADGLDWDMPNDGIGNTKNTKSHLYAFETPPAMWRGVREDSMVGVAAGFKHIKFMVPTQQELDDVSAYIQSLSEEVSPYRNADGSMTADAIAGKAIFESSATQCAVCHTGKYLTDLKVHDVGTKDKWDIDGNYYTPPLTELWRTAPYLHDGSAATMRDVLTTKNAGDRHGRTSQLTNKQLDQLEAYMLQAQGTPELQVPTAPGNLEVTGKTDTTVSLSWTASTGDGGVTGYNIYRGSTLAGTASGTAYTVTGLTADTEYTFTVRAKDAAGILSAESNAVSVKTDSSSQPFIYGDLNNDGSVNSIDVTLLKAILLGSAPENVNMQAADVNTDGLVNSIDYAILKSYILGAIDSLPV